MFLINLNAEIVVCILSFRKSRHKPNLESTSKYRVSPDLEKKMAAFWACTCKLFWTLLSPARFQPLYGAGRKESSGTGLVALVLHLNCTALSKSELSSFFLYIVINVIISMCSLSWTNWSQNNKIPYPPSSGKSKICPINLFLWSWAGGTLRILQSDWFRQRAVFSYLLTTVTVTAGNSAGEIVMFG